MRAIFIDPFRQKVEEVNLPFEVVAFQKEIRGYLKTEHFKIVCVNEMVTVIFDELALSKDTPSFWLDFLSDFLVFGNVICVGRHPFTHEMKDLDDMYSLESFNIKWFDKIATENYKKIITALTK
jgi:hypothetical protein